MPTYIQLISRNNDVNGNPYRLLLVYGANGAIDHAVEFRSSTIDESAHIPANHVQLPTIHVATAEYKALRSRATTVIRGEW